jgi:DNA-binding response OmpR family regulator
MSITMTAPQMRRGEVTVDGRTICVPKHLHDLLTLLVMNRDRPAMMTCGELIECLWPDPDVQPVSGTTYVSKLIYKLRLWGIPIDSVHGQGWRLGEPVQLARAA